MSKINLGKHTLRALVCCILFFVTLIAAVELTQGNNINYTLEVV